MAPCRRQCTQPHDLFALLSVVDTSPWRVQVPDLVKAAIDGRLPYGMGIARLTDLPAEWSRQREMLGFPSH